jgi:hypothetical protein
LFPVVAQQSNAVAFKVRSHAVRTRFIVNRQPQERHFSNVLADRQLQRSLGQSDGLWGATAVTPRFADVLWIVNILQEGFAYSQPKDRTSVIAATVPIPAMGAKATPEFCFRVGGYGVRAYSNNPQCRPILANLTVFEKEVDAALRPPAFCGAVAKQPVAADSIAEFIKDFVKLINVISAVHA